jgi:hypothetical protein
MIWRIRGDFSAAAPVRTVHYKRLARACSFRSALLRCVASTWQGRGAPAGGSFFYRRRQPAFASSPLRLPPSHAKLNVAGRRSTGVIDMPKMTDREKLADLDKRQRALADEAETVRRNLRARYGTMLADIPVERLGEREFRDVLNHAVRTGGSAAVAALKALPATSP